MTLFESSWPAGFHTNILKSSYRHVGGEKIHQCWRHEGVWSGDHLCKSNGIAVEHSPLGDHIGLISYKECPKCNVSSSIGFLVPKNLYLGTKIIFLSELVEKLYHFFEIIRHIGCHLGFLNFPKGDMWTPTLISLYTYSRWIICRENFIRQKGVGPKTGVLLTILLSVFPDIKMQAFCMVSISSFTMLPPRLCQSDSINIVSCCDHITTWGRFTDRYNSLMCATRTFSH